MFGWGRTLLEINVNTMTAQQTQHELVEQPAPQSALSPSPITPVIDVTPAGMLATALARGASLEQLQMLVDLQKQMKADEAVEAYNEDFARFKAEAVEILKRKRVRFENSKGGITDYKHAELSDVVEAVGPALSRHGFSWSWTPKQSKDWIDVTCTLKHRRGHSESVTMGGPPDQSGGKNAIQAIISTTTYLERHTLKAIAGVSEKGDDDDGRGGPAQRTEDQQAKASEVEALRDAGQNAALHGTDALNKWWGSLNAKQRGLMNSDFGAMRKAARAADAEGGAA